MRIRLRYLLLFILGAGVVGPGVYIGAHRMPAVLLYHTVSRNPRDELYVTPEDFRRQMEWLSVHGRRGVSLDEVLNGGRDGVALTFDRLTRDEHEIVIPELRRRGWTATFFVCTSSLRGPGALTPEELRGIAETGFAIESHSVRHLWLTRRTDDLVKGELVDSRREIEALTGRPVRYFAYPFGAVDERVKRLARESGYQAAFAVTPGRSFEDADPYALRRVPVRGWMPMRVMASGYYPALVETLGITSPRRSPRLYVLLGLFGAAILGVLAWGIRRAL